MADPSCKLQLLLLCVFIRLHPVQFEDFELLPVVADWHTSGMKMNDPRGIETEGCDGGKGRDFA